MAKYAIHILFCLMLMSGFASADKMVKINRLEILEETPEERAARRHPHVGRAKENFLNLQRDKFYGLPKAALAADGVDTVHIIAFRVAFAYEETDDPYTTGRGVFDNRDSATFVNEQGHYLDPAPHNRRYFETHLRSLSHYYSVVSNGRLYLDYEVWPQGDGPEDTTYYQLDHQMGYYGAQDPSYGLAALFHDGLNTAYNVDGGNFSFTTPGGDKKAIMLFHAGADRQTDLSFSATPTPYDLYTGFTTYDGDSRVFLGPDTITEGIIMPETMAQDNRVTVMNAVMAHEFGHQLGLVDLYNTGSSPFLSQMGDFALMDNNGMNTAAYIDEFGLGAFGTVPIFPTAWSRAYLGFDDVVEYREGTSIELAAVKMQSDGVKIAKIPISATEYYLIENRRGDIDGQVDGLRVDSITNVVLWPVKQEVIIDSTGHLDTVLSPVAEYDLYIPDNASGLAIWHIDEAVAAMDYYPFDIHHNNFESNTLQWDPNRRFITLVEADGNIDFGGNFVRGYGQAIDLFYEGNNTDFSSYTNPPTLSNDGGYTHYRIDNISAPGLTMTFDVSRDKFAENFPRRMAIPTQPDLSPIAFDLDDDGADEIIMVSNDKVLAITTDGKDFMDPNDELDDFDTIYSSININTASYVHRPTDTSVARLPVFAQVLSGTISTSPIIAQIAESTLVLVGTDNGWVYSYLPYSTSASSPSRYRARLFSIRSTPDVGAVIAIMPDVEHELVHVLYEDGSFVAAPYDSSATIFDIAYEFGEGYLGHCYYTDGLALVFSRNDHSVLYMTRFASMAGLGDSLVVDSVEIDNAFFHKPVASDFNRDGNDEIVLVDEAGDVYAYSFTASGIVTYDDLNISTGNRTMTSPVVCDYTGDGFPELFLSGVNKILGFDRSGYAVNDFPLDVDPGRNGQLIVTSPLISDVNGDDRLDFSVVSFDSIPRERSVLAYRIEYPDTVNFPDSFIVIDTVIDYSYYNYYSNLYVVSPGFRRMQGYPVPVGIFGMKALDDVTIGIGEPLHAKNGAEGMLITAGANGWIDAWNCSWSDDLARWTMNGRTPLGVSYLPLDSLGQESAKADFLPESDFFNYPNPATGSRTTIRYYVSKPSEVQITIYDGIGDKVEEFARTIEDGNRVDELDWNISNVASGIYHCRLEATASDGSTSEVIFKTIAVVK
ncbi:MAG: T9SS type A sorting domain-containing protein [Candidatus Zixiibacteriota bacterium]